MTTGQEGTCVTNEIPASTNSHRAVEDLAAAAIRDFLDPGTVNSLHNRSLRISGLCEYIRHVNQRRNGHPANDDDMRCIMRSVREITEMADELCDLTRRAGV